MQLNKEGHNKTKLHTNQNRVSGQEFFDQMFQGKPIPHNKIERSHALNNFVQQSKGVPNHSKFYDLENKMNNI